MRKNRDAAQDAQTLAEIETLASGQNIPRAIDLARAALDDGLVHPLLLNLRSSWLVAQGRQQEALADLRQAVAIAPGDLFVRNALGMLLVSAESYGEALPLLKETAELMPESPLAQYSYGFVLERMGEIDGARRQFETTVALDPTFLRALPHLADFAQRRSDWEAAKEYANRALALDSNHYVARTILAIVSIAEGNLEQAELLLLPLIGRRADAPLDASLARRVLGDLRHAQGRYAQAFQAYTLSNRQKYDIYAKRYDQPGATGTDYCRWLSDYFDTADPAQWSAARDLSNEPDDPRDGAIGHVFLVGFPRSGTTLLENVLASHPDVCTLEEKDTFGDLTHQFLVDEEGRERLAQLAPAGIAEARKTYWARVKSFGADVTCKVFVDKYPLSSLKLPMVARLFPKARVLFAVRDPRDVVLSCYRRNFAMNSSMFEFLSIDRAARFYDAAMTTCDVYRRRLGLPWRQVRNETLVEDFEGEARAIVAFMGLAWNEQMKDFAEHARSRTIRTPSSTQVVKGINREGVGVWRHYEKEMSPAMPYLARWIKDLGYADA
ncbi:MAG: sulfotransferase [Alphaproteobacteria bacterium]|nr:sulfotransferase [Alphaproteobacteria bacterium]MBL6937925.1 sulfotransferase [Alphaproteobacteria bacterium]MBL7099250.1 sulfotransferase [Alphaproteobacteria bacterium]